MTIRNPYNLPMLGLEEAAAETRNLRQNSGCVVQISYNFASGEVIARYHASENSWTVYADPSIETIVCTPHRMTMGDIAESITHAYRMTMGL